MKTTTKAKTKTKVANDDSLIIPFRSVNQIIDDFAAAAKKKESVLHDSTSFDNLVLVAKRLADLYSDSVFGLNEFLSLSVSLDLDLKSQKAFFTNLIKFLKSNHCVREIPSIDGGLYQLI